MGCSGRVAAQGMSLKWRCRSCSSASFYTRKVYEEVSEEQRPHRPVAHCMVLPVPLLQKPGASPWCLWYPAPA